MECPTLFICLCNHPGPVAPPCWSLITGNLRRVQLTFCGTSCSWTSSRRACSWRAAALPARSWLGRSTARSRTQGRGRVSSARGPTAEVAIIRNTINSKAISAINSLRANHQPRRYSTSVHNWWEAQPRYNLITLKLRESHLALCKRNAKGLL